MLCPKCGKEINEGDVICLNCGTLLTGISTYNETEEIKPVETIDFDIKDENEKVEPQVEDQNNNYFKKLDISFVPNTVTPEAMAAMEMNEEVKPTEFVQTEEVKPLNNDSQTITPVEVIPEKQEVSSDINVFKTENNDQSLTNNFNSNYGSNINYGGMPQPQLNEINNQPNYASEANISFTEINPALNQFKSTFADESNNVPSVVPEEIEEQAPQEQPVKKIEQKPKKEKKQMNIPRKKALYMALVLVAVIVVTVFGIYFYAIKKAPKTYSVGDDSMPSITDVVGKRKLSYKTSTNSDDVIMKKYEYRDVKDVYTDLFQYIQYLTNVKNFINTQSFDLNDTAGTVQLGTESVTDGYVIEVSIEYNTDYYIITVRRAPGTLTRY